MIEEFKNKLMIQLRGDLPGEQAHLQMMPTARDENLVFPGFKTAPVKSAVMVLFYKDNSNYIKFPLIQRPTYNGAHSGQVGLPGGKAEPFDQDLVSTALRETREEIGISPEKIHVLGKLTDLHIAVSNFIVTPVLGVMNEKPVFVIDKLEVDEVIESNLADIIDPAKRKHGTIKVRGKYRIETPYFDIGNRIVWGATAMMLNELSIVIKNAGIVRNESYGTN